MALVRCPNHGLVYNDANPRGCPACAQEKQGRRGQASVMQELAKASRRKERAEVEPPPPPPAAPEGRPQRRSNTGIRGGGAGAAWGVLRTPPGGGDAVGATRPWDVRRILFRFGPVVIVGLIVALVLVSRASFVAQPDPPDVIGEPRPIPIDPRQPITTVFAILGTQNPSVHPQDQSVERYSYGTELVVDAINGFVYSLDLGVANRTWRGLQVGMSEQEAEGYLALLAHPTPGAETAAAQPQVVSGYQVYPGPHDRPVRTRVAAVRPPNGCYDVIVDIQPRQLGLLITGEQRYSAVAREGETVHWVVTRIRVVDRSRAGPIDSRAC
jgi:hypothetical protein